MDTLVPASTFIIDWPYETLNDKEEPHGKYLLYLLGEPVVEGPSKDNVNCSSEDLQQIVNPEGFRVSSRNEMTDPSAGKKILSLPIFTSVSNFTACMYAYF